MSNLIHEAAGRAICDLGKQQVSDLIHEVASELTNLTAVPCADWTDRRRKFEEILRARLGKAMEDAARWGFVRDQQAQIVGDKQVDGHSWRFLPLAGWGGVTLEDAIDAAIRAAAEAARKETQ